MDKLRFTLTDRFGALIIVPLGVDDIVIEYTKEQEESKRDYSKTLQGSLILKGEPYDRLMRIENSIYRCTEQFVKIERLCDAGTYMTIFNGIISLNNAEFDIDNCYIEVSFSENTPYKCLDDKARDKYNILSYGDKIEVQIFRPGIKIETIHCQGLGDRVVWCGSGKGPEEGMWQVYESQRRIMEDQQQSDYDFRYCRETITLPCAESPGKEWITVGVCAGGVQKWARNATIVNRKYEQNYNEVTKVTTITTTSEILLYKTQGRALRNGRLLSDVLKLLVTESCGFVVRSNFFQINPPNPSQINYVTQEISQTNNIVVFQKSDVKRPNDAMMAAKGEIKFEDLMEFLKIAFNVDYRLEGNNFILEHVSFFNRNKGFDFTDKKYDRYTAGTNKYTYKSDEIPASEKWKAKENGGGDFKEATIYYSGACVTNKNKNDKEYTIDNFTTDLEYVLSNPEPDSSNVEDSGFVVISAGYSNNTKKYYVNTTNIIGHGNILNNVFSVAHLVRSYHFYERPLLFGTLDNKEVKFRSTKPIKKGESITIPYYCYDNFNPDDYVKTTLGNGIVEKATFDINSNTLDVELMYVMNEGLESNDKPTVTNYSVITHIDLPIEIDLLENAKDPQGDETIQGYEIIRHPTGGVLTEIDNRKVLYTPNEIGQDLFSFSVYDEWGEHSKESFCSIQVRDKNRPPIANDNYYEAYAGEELNVGESNGLFSNDSHQYGFELFDYDKKSDFGSDVLVYKNGAFKLNALPNKYGTDNFSYTIIDEQGLKATAKAFILIKDKNQIVTNEIKYFTGKNNKIMADGEAPYPKLQSNDISPSGEVISVIAETKQTKAGGNVVIQSSGNFTYTPPLNFIGEDNFNYTAVSENSQAVGKASIYVSETIYVKLSLVNQKFQDIKRMCNGAMQLLGSKTTADVQLSFYKDFNATQKLDVTGMGLRVRVRNDSQINGSNHISTFYTNQLNGTSDIIRKQQTISHTERDCDGFDYVIYTTESYSIVEGNGYSKTR